MNLTFLSTQDTFSVETFPKGAVLLVDKPLGFTSFDVVKKLRYELCKRLKSKKLKVGHAGTLDPLATGLLIICVGDYTKKIDNFQAMEKEYTGTITLGATTPSYDLEKTMDAFFPTAHLNNEILETARQEFLGEIQQIPPMYSAVKVDGKRMYKNARTGETVELEPRTITVSNFSLSPLREMGDVSTEVVNLSAKFNPILQYPEYKDGRQTDFVIACSKGTYIRSIAFDFGVACASGGYLSALRRTKTGGFSVDNAPNLEQWVEWIATQQ
jgi:tRNA pseudouridine55 synthase